ncbi:MAG TPA: COX15/CtaA family protein [Gemmatimonadales bacterium]|nr:COX15/CtaA family protein [Gemmatimonadales bacterium]
MTRRFAWLAWSAATCTYLLIILGAIVRITGSGMGCGEHWPLCNGRLLPPLDVPTMIEYAHRLVAAAVSVLVTALAAHAWWLRRRARGGEWDALARTSYMAVGLLILQVLLGAVTVKLRLPPWTVVLHLGTAMLLLATLLVIARLTPVASPGFPSFSFTPGWHPGLVALGLGFVSVLLGALTANLGAASACLGFPLCNGQLVPAGSYLQYVHWTHRVFAYTLSAYVIWWAVRTKARGAWYVVALVTLQIVVAAAMVLLALPPLLQAAHVAVGTAIWASLVLVEFSVVSHQSSVLTTDDLRTDD